MVVRGVIVVVVRVEVVVVVVGWVLNEGVFVVDEVDVKVVVNVNVVVGAVVVGTVVLGVVIIIQVVVEVVWVEVMLHGGVCDGSMLPKHFNLDYIFLI